MQRQFRPAEPEKPREGYTALEDLQAAIDKGVAEKMSALQAVAGELIVPEKNTGDDGKSKAESTPLDDMDRSEMIAFIEQYDLKIDAKTFKAPGTLKSAIIAALAEKEKEDAA